MKQLRPEGRHVGRVSLRGHSMDVLKGGAGVPKTHGAIGPMKARKERPWHGSRGRLQLLLQRDAFAQRLLRQVRRRDVAGDTEDADQPPLAIEHGRLGGFQQHLPAFPADGNPRVMHPRASGGDRRPILRANDLRDPGREDFVVHLADNRGCRKNEETLGGGVTGDVPALRVFHPDHVGRGLKDRAEDSALVFQLRGGFLSRRDVVKHDKRRALTAIVDEIRRDTRPPPLAGLRAPLDFLAGHSAGFRQGRDESFSGRGIAPELPRL